MAKKTTKDLPYSSRTNNRDDVRMSAKITNQINTNQQCNMVLSAYCATAQNCSTVNINFG